MREKHKLIKSVFVLCDKRQVVEKKKGILNDFSVHLYVVSTLACLLAVLLDLLLFHGKKLFSLIASYFTGLTQVAQIVALGCGPVFANFSSVSQFFIVFL